MQIIEASADRNKDVFDAARCGLGLIGIITSITCAANEATLQIFTTAYRIKCEKAFRLREQDTVVSFEHMCDNYHDIIHSAEHVRLLWFPYTGLVDL